MNIFDYSFEGCIIVRYYFNFTKFENARQLKVLWLQRYQLKVDFTR